MPGRANEADRNRQRDEATGLFGQLADQIKAAAEQAKRYAGEDLGVRLLTAQGHDKEAAALRLQLDQQREYAAAAKAGMDADYLGKLQYIQGLEAVKAAQDAVTQSALNMVSGYKLQATVFGAMNPRNAGGGIGSQSGGTMSVVLSGGTIDVVGLDGGNDREGSAQEFQRPRAEKFRRQLEVE